MDEWRTDSRGVCMTCVTWSSRDEAVGGLFKRDCVLFFISTSGGLQFLMWFLGWSYCCLVAPCTGYHFINVDNIRFYENGPFKPLLFPLNWVKAISQCSSFLHRCVSLWIYSEREAGSGKRFNRGRVYLDKEKIILHCFWEPSGLARRVKMPSKLMGPCGWCIANEGEELCIFPPYSYNAALLI